jgi:hypothetical protein
MTRVMLLNLFPYSLVSNAYLENINNLDIGALAWTMRKSRYDEAEGGVNNAGSL